MPLPSTDGCPATPRSRVTAATVATAAAIAPRPVTESERAAALVAYLQAMRELADAQRQVMLRFLGPELLGPRLVGPRLVGDEGHANDAVTGGARATARPSAVSAPARSRSSAGPPAPLPRKSSRTARPASAAPTTAHRTPLEALVATVSERTGYPPSMLDLDMDLEADLGIDSIKRIEILGQLRDRLGLVGMGDAARSEALEELSRYRTLRKIAEWIDARSAAGAGESVERAPSSGVRLGHGDPAARAFADAAAPARVATSAR